MIEAGQVIYQTDYTSLYIAALCFVVAITSIKSVVMP